jgi:hypothetical protein
MVWERDYTFISPRKAYFKIIFVEEVYEVATAASVMEGKRNQFFNNVTEFIGSDFVVDTWRDQLGKKGGKKEQCRIQKIRINLGDSVSPQRCG